MDLVLDITNKVAILSNLVGVLEDALEVYRFQYLAAQGQMDYLLPQAERDILLGHGGGQIHNVSLAKIRLENLHRIVSQVDVDFVDLTFSSMFARDDQELPNHQEVSRMRQAIIEDPDRFYLFRLAERNDVQVVAMHVADENLFVI